MSTKLNAFEAFEIAQQVERNGIRFYRNASLLFKDSKIRRLFSELAAWEARHEATFSEMKSQLPDAERRPVALDGEATVSDARMLAGLAVFGIHPYPSEELTGKEERAEVLRCAIEREKDSIVFYTGLKQFVAKTADADRIDAIIKEEMHHISVLSECLEDGKVL